MSTTTASRWGRGSPAVAHRGHIRAASAATATAAAVAVWAVAVPVLGTHLLVRFGGGSPQTVGAGLVAGAALAASFGGWGLLALLERHTARARSTWTAAAIIVTAASLSLPLSAGMTAATITALVLMHLAVAAVLISTLRRSAARQGATA